MSITKNALLKKYALDERTVHLDSIDADVTIRNFTAEEGDTFAKYAVKGLDAKGNPEVDLDKSMEIKYHKIATALVEPKLTVEELKELRGASGFLKEILEAMGEASPELVDAEGNDN